MSNGHIWTNRPVSLVSQHLLCLVLVSFSPVYKRLGPYLWFLTVCLASCFVSVWPVYKCVGPFVLSCLDLSCVSSFITGKPPSCIHSAQFPGAESVMWSYSVSWPSPWLFMVPFGLMASYLCSLAARRLVCVRSPVYARVGLD